MFAVLLAGELSHVSLHADTEGGFMIERVVDIAEGTLQYIQNYARCSQVKHLQIHF